MGVHQSRTIMDFIAVVNIVNTMFPTHPHQPAMEFKDLGPIIPFSRKELS